MKHVDESVTDCLTEQFDDSDEMSDGMALALRVERETSPMMYLVGLLKEMEGEDNGSGEFSCFV